MFATNEREDELKEPAPPRGTKKAEATEQTRANIIEVAMAEFAEKGLAGARVDEIADRTATSKHMIYYHFRSKEGLYRAVLEEAYRRFRTTEDSVDYEALSPEAAMTALVEKSFESHLMSSEYVRIIMGENLGRGAHIGEVQGLDRRRLIVALTARILERGAQAGTFRAAIDAMQMHMTISSLCFYFVSNRYTFGHIFDLDMGDAQTAKRRCAEIVDSVLRICRA